MNTLRTFILFLITISCLGNLSAQEIRELEGGGVRVLQLMRVENGTRRYADALPSLSLIHI